jgi:hypothetical protein
MNLLIKIDQLNQMISEQFKKYLSGFFDGDGSITVEKLSEGKGFTLRIKLFQSNENVLLKIQEIYPFMHLRGGLRNNRAHQRCQYELRAAGKQIEPLINDLLNYSILKYEQLIEAKKFLEYINIPNTHIQKEETYNKLKELKKNSTIKPYERLCKEYISGLFDAEGSIGIYNKTLRIKLTQKSDIVILQKIADMYNNNNKLDNYAISFYGINSYDFLNDIKEYTIYKTPQILAAIQYIDTLNCELTDDILSTREKLKEIIINEKNIDKINNTDTIQNTNDQENDKEYLIECFNIFNKLSTNDLMYSCKLKEIQELKVSKKCENKIFNIDWANEWKHFNIEPELEFCETPNQLYLFNYLKKKTSSLPTTATIGRQIRILVKDKKTNNYIGLLCLSSDVYYLGERDKYLEEYIHSTDKTILLKKFMNISCCVPLQPFGYNTCGGKLLVSLVFSKEVFEYHLKKYNEPIYGFVTTSIHGKSIQYDRLKELKFIGFTKGFGSVQTPDELYDVCKQYNYKYKIITYNNNRIDRFNFLKNILRHLNLSQDILQHNNKRGIYFGFLFKTKFDDNYDITELQSISEKYTQWKYRWCNNRLNNLAIGEKFKTNNDLYTIEQLNSIQFTEFKLPERNNYFVPKEIPKKIPKEQLPKKEKDKLEINYDYLINKKLTDDMIIEIMKRKKDIITTQEVSDVIKQNYNIYINRNIISKLWNNQISLPDYLQNTQEYKDMLFNEKKRTKKLTKFTEDELDFIKNNSHLDLSNCANVFYSKFNKTITKEYISQLIKSKK